MEKHLVVRSREDRPRRRRRLPRISRGLAWQDLTKPWAIKHRRSRRIAEAMRRPVVRLSLHVAQVCQVRNTDLARIQNTTPAAEPLALREFHGKGVK